MLDAPAYAEEARVSSPRAHALSVKEYLIVGSGLTGIALIGWAYMGYHAWAMANMDKVDMWMPPMGSSPWAGWDFFMLFAMWAIMMIAMMTPSTLPMVTMFATLNQKRRRASKPYTQTFVFLSGYLVAWTGFSVLATGLQWLLHTEGVLNPMMNSRSSLTSGIILVVAGIYQWTPAKDACLNFCRTPLGFLMSEWREGRVGALVMGVKHGAFCVGCCWALMLVLFAVGVMNMLWVALIAAFVLIEKVTPFPRYLRLLSGLALVAWGAVLVAQHFS